MMLAGIVILHSLRCALSLLRQILQILLSLQVVQAGTLQDSVIRLNDTLLGLR